MAKLVIILENIFKNFQLLILFGLTILFAFHPLYIPKENTTITLIFSFVSAMFGGVFINLYTDMFGTNKTSLALDALYAVLNDYYYLAGQRNLTEDENATMRKLVRIVKILDVDDRRIELFRKYKKEQVFKKALHVQNTGQPTTFDSSQLNFADMMLNSWCDPQNIMASGSANSMIDPTFNQPTPNTLMGSGELTNEPTFKTPDSPEKI